jgi:hypothetical protein
MDWPRKFLRGHFTGSLYLMKDSRQDFLPHLQIAEHPLRSLAAFEHGTDH